ncbi:MAG TPA: hypothetical protein VN931_07575 [Fibrobacteria bacterium]|nr:hypothetical protein [Fibrobacteria bacterium]
MKLFHPSLRIVWYEVVGFSAFIGISWANELGGLARSLLGRRYASNWQDAAVDTSIILLVAVPTVYMSWRQSKRLHYLEKFLRLCAWCRKVGQGEEWISVEEFLHEELGTQTTHGICPACIRKLEQSRIPRN